MTETSIATVIVVAVIAYAAWATLRIAQLEGTVSGLRTLLQMYRSENERHWQWWEGVTAEDVQAEIERNMGGKEDD